jgi:hypothetical protein
MEPSPLQIFEEETFSVPFLWGGNLQCENTIIGENTIIVETFSVTFLWGGTHYRRTGQEKNRRKYKKGGLKNIA